MLFRSHTGPYNNQYIDCAQDLFIRSDENVVPTSPNLSIFRNGEVKARGAIYEYDNQKLEDKYALKSELPTNYLTDLSNYNGDIQCISDLRVKNSPTNTSYLRLHTAADSNSYVDVGGILRIRTNELIEPIYTNLTLHPNGDCEIRGLLSCSSLNVSGTPIDTLIQQQIASSSIVDFSKSYSTDGTLKKVHMSHQTFNMSFGATKYYRICSLTNDAAGGSCIGIKGNIGSFESNTIHHLDFNISARNEVKFKGSIHRAQKPNEMNLYVYQVGSTYNVYLSLPAYHTCDLELIASGRSAYVYHNDARTGWPSSGETFMYDILEGTQDGIMYVHENGAIESSGKQMLSQTNLSNNVYETALDKAITPLGVRTLFEDIHPHVFAKIINPGISDFLNITSNLLVKGPIDDDDEGMRKLLEQYDFKYTQFIIAPNSTIWLEIEPHTEISPRIQFLDTQIINGQLYHRYQYAIQVTSYLYKRAIRVVVKRIAL